MHVDLPDQPFLLWRALDILWSSRFDNLGIVMEAVLLLAMGARFIFKRHDHGRVWLSGRRLHLFRLKADVPTKSRSGPNRVFVGRRGDSTRGSTATRSEACR